MPAPLHPINDPDERDRHIPPTDLSRNAPEEPTDVKRFEIDESTPVREMEDGSAIVDIQDDAPADKTKDFDENLAEVLDPALINRLGLQLTEDIKRDKQARAKRDEQYAEGIKRTGLGNEAPGGAQFSGASRAVHPALIEGCVDFAARAIKELFPAEGPVKSRVLGEQTKQKLQRADRKRQYMNWQLTTQIAEYRREFEVALTQLPLGGSQYLKAYYDPRWERTRIEFVPIDDILLPFEASSMRTALRLTHVQRLNRAQYEERVDNGDYIELPVDGGAFISPEQTASAQAAAKVEGVEDLAYNEDGLRIIYEVQTLLSLDGADPLAKRPLMPYVLAIDENSGRVISMRRNWDPEDNDKATPLQWIVELPFIPWRGAYAVGLAHIIGSMAGAATGALRALLDSAHVNNMPGGIKLAGAKVSGQTLSVEPTQLTEIQAGPGVDDIRKLAMPLPFNPPSAVLFQLLEWLTNQAKGVVATAEERIADASNTMPVGTALALIEQGSITFSSIHARLHAAQKELLAILHRLNAKHLKDREVVEELGELVVSKYDFRGPMDIEPVSDPNIFSDAQRYAQIQAVMQLASTMPQLYKLPQLHKRALRLLKLPNPDEILAVPEDPEELDPVSENAAATDPLKTLKAYEDQDHVAHLRVHVAFMTSPVFCANPFMAQPALPTLLAHCKEHLVLLYAQHARAAGEAQAAVTQAQGHVAGSEADAVAIADRELVNELGAVLPALMQAVQANQQFAPPPPPDPQMAAVQQRAAEAQQRNQVEQQRLQVDQQRLQLDQQRDARQAAADQARAQLEQQRADQDRSLEAWQTQLEMATANHNAHLADSQATADRQVEFQKLQLTEGNANARHRLTEQTRLLVTLLQQQQQAAEARAQREEEARTATEAHRTQLTQHSELLNTLMTNVTQMMQQRQRPPRVKFNRDAQGNLISMEPEVEGGEASTS